jgi:hypothetical protein
MPSPVALVSGLGGAIGSDFRQAANQLLFVEFAGKLSRLNLYRTGHVVSSGTTTLKGTFSFDFDSGTQSGIGQGPVPPFDVFWDQHTAVVRSLDPHNGALLANLGTVDFNSLSPDTLSSLAYAATPIDGNNDPSNKLVTNDVFAVRTSSGNYAKVKVLAYGYDLHIQWVTYALDSPYAVLGTGYNQPEDVKASADGAHAYVTERSGDLVRVTLASANRASATVVASGMTAPQQLFLDEAHHAAYVVEYAPSGSLWHVDLTSGTKTAVLSGLENAVGVVLTADLQTAYISEQAASGGRVSRFDLSSGTRTQVASGLTAPFFLTWLDAAQTTLAVAERDPANRVSAITVATGQTQVAATGLAARPSSVATIGAGQILVCCDQAIDEVDLLGGIFQPAGPLLMGIGFIPFDKIDHATGLATTDPGYFFHVAGAPFAGTLPLMINHQRAANDGAAYYRVKVDGVVHTDAWSDYHWNGFNYVLQTIGTVSVAGHAGYYPVRAIADLFLWMNPSLGDLLSTASLSNGLHTITVEFVNGAGLLVETSTPLVIRVDNNACTATLSVPTLHGTGATPDCGVLQYGTKNADPVTMAFTASHPNNFATFSFSLIKGVNSVALPASPPTSGPVSSAVSPFTAANQDLLGKCTVAGFAEYLYVAATATNGWGRQSQLDASAAVAFVLAP